MSKLSSVPDINNNAARECGICNSIASGGDKEIRTPDPMLAKHVLYQLSYTPWYKKSSPSRS